MSKIRVLLADDHAIFREGLHALLRYYDDIEVIGEAQDGEETISRVEELRPDIVLMDIGMPKVSGLEATRRICQDYPSTRVLILTQHEDRQYILPLLKMGACGYVLKRAAGKDVIEALRTVARGEVFLDPAAASTIIEEIRQPSEEAAAFTPESLTPREFEILQHIVHGKTSSQIAVLLSLSVKTVEWHRTNLMSKLGAHNIADLVRCAYEHKLVSSTTMYDISNLGYS